MFFKFNQFNKTKPLNMWQLNLKNQLKVEVFLNLLRLILILAGILAGWQSFPLNFYYQSYY